MLIRRISSLCGMVLLLSGCVSITAQSYYPEGKFPATEPNKVKIFRDVPPRSFIVIGEVYIEDSDYMDESDKNELKNKIAAIGGDAAIPDCKEQVLAVEKKVENSGTTDTFYQAGTESSCSNASYKIIRFDSD